MSGIRASAQWRLMALSVLVPIAAVAVFLIWQDYQARRTATLTNLELKSAQINAQLEDFVNTAEASTSALATLITSVSPGLANASPVSAGTLTPTPSDSSPAKTAGITMRRWLSTRPSNSPANSTAK